jgi:hypothetical protein
MNDCIRVSPRASLTLMGIWAGQMGVWDVLEKHVHIRQKVVVHTPLDKLKDAFINIVAGGHGLVEVNTRVRTDPALSAAFGRSSCAEQSTISETLNRCTEENAEQMRAALRQLYQRYGAGYHHPYGQAWQLLDVDMTGLPAGRQGEGSLKGYFAGQKNRRGRQMGRVVATRYAEIVVDRLYDGKTQLERSLQPLVQEAEEVLALNAARRKRTIIRVDGGGGSDKDINWLLARDYRLLVKVKNWQRAVKLCRSVSSWHRDPKVPEREVGWVQQPHAYERPTRQLAIRMRQKKGNYTYMVLVFNLSDETLFWLTASPLPPQATTTELLLAALYAYDRRSGAAETLIKSSKQGLGLNKRNKKRFAAQEMLVLLAQLAHNLITWTRNRLASHSHSLARWGMLRLVRDAFHISGLIQFDSRGRIRCVTLNQAHALSVVFVKALSSYLARDGTSVILGQI